MQTTTVGQLLVDDALPEDMRGQNQVLDKKGVGLLLGDVARRHPEQYRQVSKSLSDVGWKAAQDAGGFSFGIQHLQKSRASAAMRQGLQQKIQQALDDDRLSDKQREELVVRLAGAAMKPQQEQVYQEALAAGNPLAKQVLSGARGNKMNLSSLMGSDLLYTDNHDQVIPIPVLRSYSEGLTPWEAWAGSYGARKGVVAVKESTANAGYLAKQLNQITHRLVVTDLDDEQGGNPERGLPTDVSDPDNEGALLARDTGGYKKNTVLTPKILAHLKQTRQEKILVRSPIAGSSHEGGVYSRDVGVRESGRLLGRGEYVGLTASQAMTEPITQGGLSSKHSGGVAGEAKAVSGFDYINSMIQIPEFVKGGATHSEADGIVGKIEDNPVGGQNVFVNGEKHYVQAGNHPSVEPGNRVEAGDVLSDGIPNPAKVVEHKGIGEGRRYFIKAFKDAMEGAGLKAHRRNIELLSRGLINHVRLTDEMGDYVPGDVVPYSTIESQYQPRKEAKHTTPSLARGRYLEQPVLHYSIGTRIKPSTQKTLEDYGIKDILVHDDPPPFAPEMVRGMSHAAADPDWMSRQYGSGIKGSLLKAVHRGATSDEQGTSFVPSLARGLDFGRDPQALTRKPDPGFEVKASAASTFRNLTVTEKVEKIAAMLGRLAGTKTANLFTGADAPGSAQGTGSQPPSSPAPADELLSTLSRGASPSAAAVESQYKPRPKLPPQAQPQIKPVAEPPGVTGSVPSATAKPQLNAPSAGQAAAGDTAGGQSGEQSVGDVVADSATDTAGSFGNNALMEHAAAPMSKKLMSGAKALPGAIKAVPGAIKAAPGALADAARAAPGALADAARAAPGMAADAARTGINAVKAAPGMAADAARTGINAVKAAPGMAVDAAKAAPGFLADAGRGAVSTFKSTPGLIKAAPGAVSGAARAGEIGAEGAGAVSGAARAAELGAGGLSWGSRLGSGFARIAGAAAIPATTGIDTAIGVGKDFYAGGGNPLKGLNIRTKEMMNDRNVSLNPLQTGRMDAITNGVAAAREMGQNNGVAGAVNFAGDFITLGTGTNLGNKVIEYQDANATQNKLNTVNSGMQRYGVNSFKYGVGANGAHVLTHGATGSVVPNSFNDFSSKVSPQNQAAVARDLATQMPDKFNAVFSDPQFFAMQSGGVPIPPEVQARQDQRMAQVRRQYGLQ